MHLRGAAELWQLESLEVKHGTDATSLRAVGRGRAGRTKTSADAMQNKHLAATSEDGLQPKIVLPLAQIERCAPVHHSEK